jgi:hypothetical protein
MKRFAVSLFCTLCMSASLLAQDWIPLQDGKSLDGWKAGENPQSWTVQDGMFVSRGERAHLYYVGKVAKHDFKNFELSAEVMTSPGANSGIYVHTKWQGPGWPVAGYELQVINSNPPAERLDGFIEHKMTGSIYAVRNTWIAPVKDDEWFTYRIRVVGKTIQTFIGDRLVCEYAEPADAFRPDDKKGRLLGSGTFALQAHDPTSVVKFRNIKVKAVAERRRAARGPRASRRPRARRARHPGIERQHSLIDLGLAAPPGDAAAFWSDVRRHGMSVVSEFPTDALRKWPGSIVVIVDKERAPDVALLKAAKTAGAKVAFSSGGTTQVDEARLKARLRAIKEAGLVWQDFWVPGK